MSARLYLRVFAWLLLQLQAHRAELYSRLGEGFRDFLGSGQEGLLAQLMAQHITPGFTAVSQQVRWARQVSMYARNRSVVCCRCVLPGSSSRPGLTAVLRQVQRARQNIKRLA